MSKIPLYNWIQDEFTVRARADSVGKHEACLRSVISAGTRVVDLCCGGGAFSFLAETLGATTVGVDVDSGLLAKARGDAESRQSQVEFVEANIFEVKLGSRFDVALLLGNTLADFTPSQVRALGFLVRELLEPGGQLLVGYLDGLRPFVEGTYAREGVQRESPERISWRYHSYDPSSGAVVEEYERQPGGDRCHYRSHVYSPAVVRALLAGGVEWEAAEPLGDNAVLDRFRRVGAGEAKADETLGNSG